MPAGNNDIAKILDEVADLLEISGESFFRVRAYRNASRVIRDLATPVHSIVNSPNSRLEDLPGIGKDLAMRITEIIHTGDLSLRRELESKVPPGLLEVMKVPGIGPRRAHRLYLELGVKDIESLEEVASKGLIRNLAGFGEKTETNILQGITTIKGFGNRFLRAEVEPYAEQIVEYMSSLRGLKRIQVAGSYRRLKETVGDLDILVSCENTAAALEKFVKFPDVEKIILQGDTRASVVMGIGLQVDMRAVQDESFGAALQYFTGSQAHGVALRRIAMKKDLKLNEYGVFRGDKKIAGKTEEEVYEALGLPWIPPELRENRGEIEIALEGNLPVLVELRDIRGDLHVHTDATDGRDDAQTVIEAARRKGYSYIAITNHSKRVSMARGLDERGLLSHWEELERIEKNLKDFHILKGVEVDILEDGSLDIAEEVLLKADYVVAAVHYNTNMSRDRMTRRIKKAISNPLVDAVAHATGRIINKRNPYAVEMEDLIAAAAKYETLLELNAAPDRLDIDDKTCLEAKRHGVKISIATDAHHSTGIDYMRYGIYQARRGWLETEDVINTLRYRELVKNLGKGRKRPKG